MTPTQTEPGDPTPDLSPDHDAAPGREHRASEDPSDRLARLQAALAARANLDPPPARWPKLVFFVACLGALAVTGWLYRGDAGERVERTISSASASEIPEQKLLEKERRRNAEIEQDPATRKNDGLPPTPDRARASELEEQLRARPNDQQLLEEERQRRNKIEEQLAARQNDLAQARARIAELEQQQAASRQLPAARQPATAAIDPGGPMPAFRPPESMAKPQVTVRRTGARPLPKPSQPMPRLSLQASGLDYNPAGYWQVTATVVSNTSRAIDARIQCSFVGAGRAVGETEFGPTSVAPGEQVIVNLIGPPTTTHVDSTTCRLVGQ